MKSRIELDSDPVETAGGSGAFVCYGLIMETTVLRRFLTAFLATLASGIGLQPIQAADKRPNILLVVADDMGWTDLGNFGSEIETPNLDKLAERGVRFVDFHTSVSCSPTRSMLLSGTDNHIAGLGNMGELLTGNQVGKPGYEGYLNDRVVSLAEVLRDGGYHTYMSGKWHLGHESGHVPFDRGFERSFSMLNGGASHWADMYGILPRDDPAKYTRDGKFLGRLPADFYSSRSYADFLMEAIRENRSDGEPFLAYLAFTAPHDPVHVPEPWLSKYRGRYEAGYEDLKARRWKAAKKLGIVPKGADVPARHPMVEPWEDLTEAERALQERGMEVYAGMLEAMDYHYGRVVAFLEDIGELDDTVVIFLSDNGANPWYSSDYPGAKEKSFNGKFDNSLDNIGKPGSNYAYGMGFASGSGGPLDRYKMTVGEGGIRVPLLVAGPGIVGGRSLDSFAYVMDIMPTVLELAELDHPARFQGREVEPMRGRSMLGLLDGSVEAIYTSTEFVGGEMGGGKWMRQGSFKASMIPKPYGNGAWALFDLSKDPGETKDLSKRMPDRLDALVAAWDEYASDVGVVAP
jgi:arylsulfatase